MRRALSCLTPPFDTDIFPQHDGKIYIEESLITPQTGLEAVKAEKIGKPQFIYELIEELALHSEEAIGDGFVVFTGVNKVKYIDFITLSSKKNWQYKVLISWFEDESILVIKTPTKAHEVAARGFEKRIFNFLLNRLGVEYEEQIKGIGSTTCDLGRVIKEADSAFLLLSRNESLPTIVIEIGVTERLRRLRNDAFLWLERSNGKVKVVIIVKVFATEGRILIEKWVKVPPPPTSPRPVSRTNPTGMNAVPTRVQHLSIYEVDTPSVGPSPRYILPNDGLRVIPQIAPAGTTIVNPASTATLKFDAAPASKSYRVIGSPLLIQFEELFQRHPTALEGDLVMGEITLAALGRDIFNAFIKRWLVV